MKHAFFDACPEGAHPEILDFLHAHNLDHFVDTEQDEYARLGVKRLKQAFGVPNADIYYLPNGTITNVTVLSAMLKPFEGVICPTSGHINNYEAGGLEATGHKIIPVDSPDGKLTEALIDKAMLHYKSYETVVPRVVYLTQVTESGTVYSKNELIELINHSKSRGLYTYLDGARLAMALTSKAGAMSPTEFGRLGIDVFYVGGTKNGGMYGEAVVINNDVFKPDFIHYAKRQGALLNKQRFIDLQFARFFAEDNLWLQLAEQANSMAERLRQGLVKAGGELVPGSEANHAMVIMNNLDIVELEKSYGFARWEVIDGKATKIRLVCSWVTNHQDVDDFLKVFKEIRNRKRK